MQSNVQVMNNVETGYDTLWVDKNTCHNCITLHIPQPDDSPIGKGTLKVIELNAVELLEFLVRTQPALNCASVNPKAPNYDSTAQKS